MKNKVGREIPTDLSIIQRQGIFQGAFALKPSGRGIGVPLRFYAPGHNKILSSIQDAIEAVELKDGMTISFHHALRNGDAVMEQVIAAVAKKGIKNLRIAASSLPLVTDALVPYIESGVINRIDTSGARGKIGQLIHSGILAEPAVFRTHGGRARAIMTGDLEIDVAFIAAPACDSYGNITGTEGPAACGSLGYAKMDAQFAQKVVAITDCLVDRPLQRISIPQTQVDFIVPVESIGDPAGIATGSLRGSMNPADKVIAGLTAEVIRHSGYLKEGFSMQFGSGGTALSAAAMVGKRMKELGIRAGSGVGGMTGTFVDMMEDGLVDCFFDPQDFDERAIRNLAENPKQIEVSAGDYANPFTAGAMVNQLDFAVLSAMEVDLDFNVNVLTDSYGAFRGAMGGHPDAAAGAAMTIITLPLLRGRLPMIVEKATTVVTPGETVDVVVTDFGVSIHPLREDLKERLKGKGLPIFEVEDLYQKAISMTGKPKETCFEEEVRAVVEYRDGTILDVIRKPI